MEGFRGEESPMCHSQTKSSISALETYFIGKSLFWTFNMHFSPGLHWPLQLQSSSSGSDPPTAASKDKAPSTKKHPKKYLSFVVPPQDHALLMTTQRVLPALVISDLQDICITPVDSGTSLPSEEIAQKVLSLSFGLYTQRRKEERCKICKDTARVTQGPRS